MCQLKIRQVHKNFFARLIAQAELIGFEQGFDSAAEGAGEGLKGDGPRRVSAGQLRRTSENDIIPVVGKIAMNSYDR